MTRYVVAFARWLELLATLASVSAGQRFPYSNWPGVVAIIEPMGLIIALSAVHEFVGTRPPFGDSIVIFFATGLIPYYLFFNVSLKIRGLDLQRRLPGVSRFDFAVSYVLGELFIKLSMLVGILVSLYAWGLDPPAPRDILGCFPPLIALSLLGLAVGIFNMVVVAFWRSWYYFYVIALRATMLVSSVLYVMDLSPPPLRDITVYNPLAHAITWFRQAYYHGYPAMLLDVGYLAKFIAVSLTLAILLDLSTRAYRRAQ